MFLTTDLFESRSIEIHTLHLLHQSLKSNFRFLSLFCFCHVFVEETVICPVVSHALGFANCIPVVLTCASIPLFLVNLVFGSGGFLRFRFDVWGKNAS